MFFDRAYPDFLLALLETSTCAALRRESRMQIINATGTDLSTVLPRISWVGRRPIIPLSKHSQEGTAEPQISPLRCAPVEMTKGRAVLPGRVVAEQEPFFITLDGVGP
jgi:hypothetical protein